MGHVSANMLEERGRGGHPVISYDISENGRILRSDTKGGLIGA